MSPIEIITASFGVLSRNYPPRDFIKQCTLENVVITWLLAQCVQYLPMVVMAVPMTQQFAIMTLITSALYIACIVYIGGYVLNMYAAEKFSNTEVFALDVVLTAASTIVFGVIAIAEVYGGPMVALGLSVVTLGFAIYVILTLVSAISVVAGITKHQAANVLIAPTVPMLIVGFLVMSVLSAGMEGDASVVPASTPQQGEVLQP